MALINCRECGREISSEAISCPHCGCPQNQTEYIHKSPINVIGRKRKKLIIPAAILAIAFAMVVSCPSREKHEEAVTQLGTGLVKRYTMESSNIFGIGIASFFGERIIDMLVQQMLRVDSYGVCSVGKLVKPNGESQVVTIGIFGKIFTVASEDDIYEKMNEKDDDKKEKTASEKELDEKAQNANVIQIEGSKE